MNAGSRPVNTHMAGLAPLLLPYVFGQFLRFKDVLKGLGCPVSYGETEAAIFFETKDKNSHNRRWQLKYPQI